MTQSVQAYEWPAQPVIEAPPRVSGQLVTWSEYKGFGAEEGLLAWVGGVRIGRIGLGVDRCEWWCALPHESDDDIGGFGSAQECKAAIEGLASRWADKAGLVQAPA